MRLLAAPCWSFGRDRRLLREMIDLVEASQTSLHYAQSSIDLNRTVLSISGSASDIGEVLVQLNELALPSVDLNRHITNIPRTGAFDICPFLSLDQTEPKEAIESIASRLSELFTIPVFLCEKSERPRPEMELTRLRSLGFGGLMEKELNPDFGPNRIHPQWGVAFVGLRDPWLMFGVKFQTEALHPIQQMCSRIAALWEEGDERFVGVHATALGLPSDGIVMIQVEMLAPNMTDIDPILGWISERANHQGILVAGAELIGAIRRQDLPGAIGLNVEPNQIVDVDHGI